jgi:hypothetical protein
VFSFLSFGIKKRRLPVFGKPPEMSFNGSTGPSAGQKHIIQHIAELPVLIELWKYLLFIAGANIKL